MLIMYYTLFNEHPVCWLCTNLHPAEHHEGLNPLLPDQTPEVSPGRLLGVLGEDELRQPQVTCNNQSNQLIRQSIYYNFEVKW